MLSGRLRSEKAILKPTMMIENTKGFSIRPMMMSSHFIFVRFTNEEMIFFIIHFSSLLMLSDIITMSSETIHLPNVLP
jgi:hypothetical protein